MNLSNKALEEAIERAEYYEKFKGRYRQARKVEGLIKSDEQPASQVQEDRSDSNSLTTKNPIEHVSNFISRINENKCRKYINYAKTTSQVIDIIADVFKIVLDSIGSLKNIHTGGGNSNQDTSESKFDLSGILQTVEKYVARL